MNEDRLIEFVDYIIKEPSTDDHNIGYKFPFNACEVLCSENVYVINKLFENSTKKDEVENVIKNNIDIEEAEFSGRKSIIMPFGKEQLEEDEENKKETHKEGKLIDHIDESDMEFVDGSVAKSKSDENDANICKEEDKNFLDSLESKEDVLSVTKEAETGENSYTKIFPDYPLINHLFSMLNNESSLNYLLAGYFYKFFSHLIQLKGNIFVPYLLIHKKNFIDNMIKNLNRKSISDCVMKLLVSNVPDFQDGEIKKEILEKVINSLNGNDNEVR